jgi:hypothetical protein
VDDATRAFGQWMSLQPQRVPYCRNQSLVRAGSWCALAVVVWFVTGDASVVVLDAVDAGVGNIPFSDMLARVIPPKLRARTRGGRGVAGAIAAGTADVLIHFVRFRPTAALAYAVCSSRSPGSATRSVG